MYTELTKWHDARIKGVLRNGEWQIAQDVPFFTILLPGLEL